MGGFSNFNTPQASTCPVPLHLWQGFSRSSSPVPPAGSAALHVDPLRFGLWLCCSVMRTPVNGDRNALVKLRWGLSSCAGDGVPLRDITVERDISRHHAREGEVLLDVLTYRCG